MESALDDLARSARLATENGAAAGYEPTASTFVMPETIAPENDPRTAIVMQRMHNASLLPAAIRAAGRRSQNVEDRR